MASFTGKTDINSFFNRGFHRRRRHSYFNSLLFFFFFIFHDAFLVNNSLVVMRSQQFVAAHPWKLISPAKI